MKLPMMLEEEDVAMLNLLGFLRVVREGDSDSLVISFIC